MEPPKDNGSRQWPLQQSSVESDFMQGSEQAQETRRRSRRARSMLQNQESPPGHRHPAGISKRVQPTRKNSVDTRNAAQYIIRQQQFSSESAPGQSQSLNRNPQNPKTSPAPKATTAQQNILGMQQFSPQQTFPNSSHQRFQPSPAPNAATQQKAPRIPIDPMMQYPFVPGPSPGQNPINSSSRDPPNNTAPKAQKRDVSWVEQQQQVPLGSMPRTDGPKPHFFSCFYQPTRAQTRIHSRPTAFDPSRVVSIPRNALRPSRSSYKDVSCQTDITMEPGGSYLGVGQLENVADGQAGQEEEHCNPASTQKEQNDIGVDTMPQLQPADTRAARLNEIGMNPLVLYEWSQFESTFNKQGSGGITHGQGQGSFTPSSKASGVEVRNDIPGDPMPWDQNDCFESFFGGGQPVTDHEVTEHRDEGLTGLNPMDWVGQSLDFGEMDVAEELAQGGTQR